MQASHSAPQQRAIGSGRRFGENATVRSGGWSMDGDSVATMAAVTRALDDLIALLDLEPIEVNIFRGVSPDDDRQRVFGGQVAGQALVAAGRTVDGKVGRDGAGSPGGYRA